MELQQSQKQTQTLSPQMIQAMKVLQMGSQELLEYIEEAVQENPVLESEDQYADQDESTLLRRKLEWLESTDPQNRYFYQQDSEDSDPLANCGGGDEEEDLYHYVLSQVQMLELDPQTLRAAAFLVESLNGSGWLDETLEELAADGAFPLPVMERALAAVQSLDPAGVAARSLGECLRLQLLRRKPVNELALRIVDGCLEDLSKSHYGQIAKKLGAAQEKVHAACELIRTLEPRPGTGFASRENVTYITPDIIVVNFPDHFELLTNDYFFPSIKLSGYYTHLWKESDDPEVKEYLAGKVQNAKWVVHSIEQRKSTLLGCAKCILEIQEAFFRRGPGHLRPLSLAEVADRLGVHESTVSRALKNKYLQCSMGVYPLNYFFPRSLGGPAGETTSADAARSLLKKLVAGEDKHKPLSDQKLCELMAKEGCELSRRTVAKYRDQLQIPGTGGRRAYD